MTIHVRPPASLELTRLRIEDMIERLLAMLDEIDGDPDLEDGADDEDGGDLEPSLGSLSPAKHGIDQRNWSHGSTDDREHADEDEGEGVAY